MKRNYEIWKRIDEDPDIDIFDQSLVEWHHRSNKGTNIVPKINLSKLSQYYTINLNVRERYSKASNSTMHKTGFRHCTR